MKIRNKSEWLITFFVIGCSVILFLALAAALTGRFIGGPSRTVEVDFRDVTGVSSYSRVKFAGAAAGRVAAIRILTPEERLASRDPSYRIRLSLALSHDVPPLREGTIVSISSDTILSDKFVQIEDGPASSPELPPGTVLSSITPTSFDQLIRNADTTLVAVNELIGGQGGQAEDLFDEIRLLLKESRSTLSEVNPLLSEIRTVTRDAGDLVVDTRGIAREVREPLLQTIARLEKAAQSFDELAVRSNNLVADNEGAVQTLLAQMSTASQNTKVATTYLKILALRLAQNPSHLIWGRTSPPPLPTEKEILSTPNPFLIQSGTERP